MKKTVIWFVSFVWLNKTNQINQKDQTNLACLRLAVKEPIGQENLFSC